MPPTLSLAVVRAGIASLARAFFCTLAKKAHRASNPVYALLPDILSHLGAERELPLEDAEAIMDTLLQHIKQVGRGRGAMQMRSWIRCCSTAGKAEGRRRCPTHGAAVLMAQPQPGATGTGSTSTVHLVLTERSSHAVPFSVIRPLRTSSTTPCVRRCACALSPSLSRGSAPCWQRASSTW